MTKKGQASDLTSQLINRFNSIVLHFQSSYVLIQELRGKFVAFFWQTFARIFGYNLKTEYDPEGEDRKIEEIVVMIENGDL
jgi:hypothetical protein